MPRAYTIATAALALQVSNKWLDNTLSHYRVQGVTQERQGIPRRLSVESLTILAVALTLVNDLETPVAKALTLATALLTSGGQLSLPTGAKIQVDIDHTSAALLERLEHAVEIAPLPRRGRPPQKATGRLD